MPANQLIYLDPSRSPLANPVLSLTNVSTDDTPLIFVGADKYALEFVFTDPTSVVTGSQSSSYMLSLGDFAATPYYTTTRFFVSHSYGVTCSLDLTSVTASFGGAEYISPKLQFAVITPSGSSNRSTKMLRSVTVYNPVDL